MANIALPSMESVWADQGDRTQPDLTKMQIGWEVEIPPRQVENYLQWRQDTAINYILQKGIPEWNPSMEYQQNISFVQYNGIIYQSLRINTNRQPNINPNDWKKAYLLQEDFGEAAFRDVGTQPTELIESSRIVQSVGTSVTGIMSQKAVTDALGATIPPGVMLMYGATNVPTGWLLCNGAAISRTTYADLFAVIGTRFGSGDGSTTFNVPNMQNMFPRGASDNRAVGSTQSDQNKSHTHSATTNTTGNHSHSGTTSNAGNHSHTRGSMDITGGFTSEDGTGDGDTAKTSGAFTKGSFTNGTAGAPGGSTDRWFEFRASRSWTGSTSSSGNHHHSFSTNTTGNHNHTVSVTSSGGDECRPVNLAFNFIIKV